VQEGACQYVDVQDLSHVVTGAKIRQRRVAAGMTQQALAEDAGVALRTLVRIEQGEDVRLGTLTALADAFGITVSELLADDAEATS
jgi:transcriptional regulator with XRE-family HTH domain